MFDPLKTEWRSCASVVLDFEERQYLVTCKHVFSDAGVDPGPARIEISGSFTDMFGEPKNARDQVPQTSGYAFVGFGSEMSDIAVLALPRPVSGLHRLYLPNESEASQLVLGGDIGILGFPRVIPYSEGSDRFHTGGFVPAVQRGCVSAFGLQDVPKVYYLGVMNTFGFSGGPMFISGDRQNPTLFGLVSGIRPSKAEVLSDGGPTGYYVLENSGIMKATDVSHALDAIKENPIGPRL